VTRRIIRPKARFLFPALGLGLVFAAIAGLAAGGDAFVHRDVSFVDRGNTLAGVLVSPAKESAPVGCIVFVHGSGDTPKDGYGYYRPYWEKFAQKGWCSLSWDKPGVGSSNGDWRNQTTADRAAEVAAAVGFLRRQPGMEEVKIGLIGFSQAGWVMPKVAQLRDDVAFVISVSGAIDWMVQAQYSTDIRLKSDGYDDRETSRIRDFGARVDQAIRTGASYETYLALMSKAPKGESDLMSRAYWKFVQLNWRANVRKDLRAMHIPVLAIFGDHDAYVDTVASARTYREELDRSSAPFFRVVTFRNADHGLMRTTARRPTHQGWRAWLVLFRIWFGGESVFPDGYLEMLQDWLDRFAIKHQVQ